MNSEAGSYFVPVSKVFYFHSSIYERLQRSRGLPRLPPRSYYTAVLFQDTHVSSSYMLLVYVTYLHRSIMCCGPPYPSEQDAKERRTEDVELSKLRWTEFYGNKGAMYFRNEFSKPSIYNEHTLRICNGRECLPHCQVKNGFDSVLRRRNVDIEFRGGGVFQFQGRVFHYYRGLGVYLKASADSFSVIREETSFVSCGELHSLELWSQEALYCYVVMRLRI